MYKLFYSPGACSFAPHLVIEELGVPFELELVSSATQTHLPAWKAMNPKGRVPALLGVPGKIGGAENLLTEAPAIMFFLARSHPEAKLLPTDPAGEARCLEWMNWLSGSVHAQALGSIWRTARFVDDEQYFPPLKAKGLKTARGFYDYIEQLLADGRDWAVPGGYSIVDAYLMIFYLWGQRLEFPMRTAFPAWAKLADKIAARPAAQRVMAKENLAVAP